MQELFYCANDATLEARQKYVKYTYLFIRISGTSNVAKKCVKCEEKEKMMDQNKRLKSSPGYTRSFNSFISL